jgi:DNA-directed RNA polymerase subunit beta'
MLIPQEKHGIINEAETQVKEIEAQYTSGLVTQGERYNKVVDIWGRAGDDIAKAMMSQLGQTDVVDRDGNTVKQESFNSIYMMADSGARGLGGADPAVGGYARVDGQARRLDHRNADHRQFPRRLNVLQYFISTHGARKGPCRHRVEDGEFGLPHAPACRRHPGPGGDRGRLQHHQRRADESAGRGW